MNKVLMTIMVIIALGGCETVKGMRQDIINLPNPDKNGWNAAKKADAWMQQNLW